VRDHADPRVRHRRRPVRLHEALRAGPGRPGGAPARPQAHYGPIKVPERPPDDRFVYLSDVLPTGGIDRLSALTSAIDLVRRGGTISLSGVYGGAADPLPMLQMFDRHVNLRIGQANVKRWIDDTMPLLPGDGDPLGVDSFATHRMPLDDAPHAYEVFQKKEDNAFKVLPKP
jgi:threonine dehydrogenase-like Zn-dependent dehydrogenase